MSKQKHEYNNEDEINHPNIQSNKKKKKKKNQEARMNNKITLIGNNILLFAKCLFYNMYIW